MIININAAIILAAGESKRLGQPKQALNFGGKTLLAHSIETTLASGCDPVIVVLGARAKECRAEAEQFPVKIIINELWSAGVGTSISAAMRELRRLNPECRSVLLTTCDQPFISATHLKRLLDTAKEKGGDIVTARYNNILGVPAVFSGVLFGELEALDGKQGAQEIIRKHSGQVSEVDLPEAAIDIDTQADLDFLIQK